MLSLQSVFCSQEYNQPEVGLEEANFRTDQ